MTRRIKSPFPGPPDATLRWSTVGEPETHSPTAKMSDTINHFIAPLAEFEPTEDLEALRGLVNFGVTIWNLGTIEMPEWAEEWPFDGEVLDEIRKIADQKDAPEGLFQIAEALLHRRRTLFGADRRLVVEFNLRRTKSGELNLQCMFAMPSSDDE